jgi:hypothetical protein
VYYCLHKFHKFPSEYLALPREERAFIVAAIETKMEKDKEQERKIQK